MTTNSLANQPTRRSFLQLAAMAGAAGIVLRAPRGWAAGSHQPVGVQLYMVRALVGKDRATLAKVLAAIRAAGYEQVEPFPGVYDYPAKELRSIITDAGLTAPSAHFPYPDFESRMGYAQELGLSYMICPMIPKEQWGTKAGFSKAAGDFNRWGKALGERGMKFAFPNHCYEFKPLEDGRTGFETLMGESDPALVGLEVDVYWAVQGGQNPLKMLDTYRGRVHLLHLKDRTPAPPSFVMDASSQHFIEMGQGAIDWKAIFAKAEAQGIHYYFLDQDGTTGSPLDSMVVSYRYIHSLLA